jgi:hypothetical protein
MACGTRERRPPESCRLRLSVAAAPVVLALVLSSGACSCSLKEWVFPGAHLPSPDGKLVASFYALGGGGAAGYMFEYVDVHTVGEAQRHWIQALELSGVTEVRLHWRTVRELEITYPSDPLVTVQRSRAELSINGGIKIRISSAPGRSGRFLGAGGGGCLASIDSPSSPWKSCDAGL